MSPKRKAGHSAVAVQVATDGGVAFVSLRYGRSAAQIDAGLAQALCDAVEELRLDSAVAVVVVQVEGPDFCRGFTTGDWSLQIDCVAALAQLPQPVVARIQGRAEAEGCELALACDLRVVDARAQFRCSQVEQGRLPRHGVTQRLPRLVGTGRALDLLLSGRAVGADEAVRIGLASRAAPADGLDAVVQEVVASLRSKGPLALRLAKEAVHGAGDLTLEQGIRLEEDLYVLLQTTGDRAEGIRAFLEKRRPQFRGT